MFTFYFLNSFLGGKVGSKLGETPYCYKNKYLEKNRKMGKYFLLFCIKVPQGSVCGTKFFLVLFFDARDSVACPSTMCLHYYTKLGTLLHKTERFIDLLRSGFYKKKPSINLD